MLATTPPIVKELRALGTEKLNNQDRRLIVHELLLARRRLQSPFEVAFDHLWGDIAEIASIKSFIDAGIFHRWEQVGKARQSSQELAELGGMSPDMACEYMRSTLLSHMD